MRASVWMALRSLLIGGLVAVTAVPFAWAGRRHRCVPCYSPCYSAPCYTPCEIDPCCPPVSCGPCIVDGACSVGPTHPDPSVGGGQPLQYPPAGPVAPGKKNAPPPPPLPDDGAAGGAAGNNAPPPMIDNNLRPAPAPAPAPIPDPAPEAAPPEKNPVDPAKPAPAEDPFAPAAAAPKANAEELVPPPAKPAEAPVADEPEMIKDEPAPAPAAEPAPAPAEDDPFKASLEGRLPSRVWTDDTGEHRVFAALVEIHEGKVRLLKETGRTTTVSFERLSPADLEYVRAARTKFGQGQIGKIAAK